MQPPLPAPGSLPEALLDYENFVCWRFEERDGKATKVPLTVNAERASTTDPSTWATIDVAYSAARARGWGIGFVFSADDPFCGIDLDKVLAAGELRADAAKILGDLQSYAEVSPSGTGLHIIVQATLPPGGRRTAFIELYDQKRFFTLTGQSIWIDQLAVEHRQAAVELLHAKLFPVPEGFNGPPRKTPLPGTGLDDREVVEHALRASNGAKFQRLWSGDDTDYGSRSEADAALCSMLSFWVGGDPERVADLYRQSGLYRPKFERQSYRDRTLALATRRQTFYTPRRTQRRRAYLGG